MGWNQNKHIALNAWNCHYRIWLFLIIYRSCWNNTHPRIFMPCLACYTWPHLFMCQVRLRLQAFYIPYSHKSRCRGSKPMSSPRLMYRWKSVTQIQHLFIWWPITRPLMDGWEEMPHKVKTQYVHLRSHAEYFLLPRKVPEEISRRSIISFHN